MKTSVIHKTQDTITPDAIENSATSRVPPGSVLLVTRSGILAHSLPIAVNQVEVSLNQDLKALIPSRGMNATFVARALQAAAREVLHSCAKAGTTVQSIEFQRLLDFMIPVAPTTEQTRVVEAIDSYLTRLDDAEATLARVKRNLERYRASVLQAAVQGRLVPAEAELARAEHRDFEPASDLLKRILADRRKRWEAAGRGGKYSEPIAPHASGLADLPEGWCWATVDQLSYDVRYGTSAKAESHIRPGIPVLRMGNIIGGHIDFSKLKYLPSDHDEFPDLLLQPGDILFNRTNSADLVGKTAVFAHHDRSCSFASYLIRLRLCDGVRSEFVSHYINSTAGRSWIASVVSQQVGQANVNGTKLRACVLPLPPSEEQERILLQMDLLLSIALTSEASVGVNHERCTLLRQALLTQAFEGRMVDQDRSDEPASELLARIKAERGAARPRGKRDACANGKTRRMA